MDAADAVSDSEKEQLVVASNLHGLATERSSQDDAAVPTTTTTSAGGRRRLVFVVALLMLIASSASSLVTYLAAGERTKMTTTDHHPSRLGDGGDDSIGSSGAINFNLQPAKFVDTISRCILDANCRIFYHHVGKTGGATLIYRMFALFPQLEYESGCCGKQVLRRFRTNKKYYCSVKFSSYDAVSAREFLDVVSTCKERAGIDLDANNTLASSSRRDWRAVVLSSFREPIARTVSTIHQLCNKNPQKRTKELLRACDRCDYEADPDVWDGYVHSSNRMYGDISYMSRVSMGNVTVVTIETVDIDPFFHQLRMALPSTMKELLQLDEIQNPEKLGRCSFGIKSAMIKALAPSEAIYRNLTLGL